MILKDRRIDRGAGYRRFLGTVAALMTLFAVVPAASGAHALRPAAPGGPAIVVEKYVSVDDQATWDSADSAPGPSTGPGSRVSFMFVVRNSGTAPLSSVSLADDVFDLASCLAIPDPLPAGSSYVCVFGPVIAILGQHQDTGTARGTHNGITVQAQDDAFYFGLRSSIGDFVWYDADANGLQDAGEPGLANVTLDLYKGADKVGSSLTDAEGAYLFTDLVPDYYVVEVTDLNGVLAGLDHVVGSQSLPTPSSPIPLGAGEDYRDADFGYYRAPGSDNGSIGDTVYYDDDHSGAQDANEDGIEAVPLQLWTDLGGECNGWVATALTGANGKYLFAGLPPAHYCVTLPPPDDDPVLRGLILSGGANPRRVTLGLDQAYLSADFGYGGFGAIRGVVWFDTNPDGAQGPLEPGISDVKVCLYGDANEDGVPDSQMPLGCRTTDSFGVYIFDHQLPGAYILTETDPQGVTSTTSNTVPAALVLGQGSGISDENNFGDTATSAYTLTKTSATVGEPFRPNTPVSFDIKITNTGNTYITVLPLRDTYDRAYLQYVNATSGSNDNNNDGTIDWSDVTATLGDLAPGASVTVQANFIALKDTSELPGGYTINTAIVLNAYADPDGPVGPLGSIVALPLKTANDTVEILLPTGILIASFAAHPREDGVLLSWETATEQAVLGFNVYREGADGELVAVNAELIIAERAGAAGGARYTLLDANPEERYVLEVVKTDGTTERYKLREIIRGS